jgi:hypothetical protein
MPVIEILKVELDGPGPALAIPEDRIQDLTSARTWKAYYMAGGMVSGDPSIILSVEDEAGVVTFLETSLKAFLACARALRGIAEHDGIKDI